MGQGLSCGEREESDLFSAVQNGEVELVKAMVESDPSVLEETSGSGKLSALHVAAARGRIEVGLVVSSLIWCCMVSSLIILG